MSHYQHQRRMYRTRAGKHWRLWPLTVIGLAAFAISLLLISLLCTALLFYLRINVSPAGFIAHTIYLLSLFPACLLVSLLSRGLRFSPALITAALSLFISLIPSGFNRFQLTPFLIRAGISVAAAVLSTLAAGVIYRRINPALYTRYKNLRALKKQRRTRNRARPR